MKVLKNYLQLSLLALLAVMVVSCSSDQTETADANKSDVETEYSTRGIKSKANKVMGYASLATFEHGQAKLDLKDLASLEGKQVNLVVLYDAMAPWAETFNDGKYDSTGDDILNGLMQSYELEIIQQFAIDEENEGLVLEPSAKLDNPVEAARELSMVDHVLMVHVKEVPAEDQVDETASNN